MQLQKLLKDCEHNKSRSTVIRVQHKKGCVSCNVLLTYEYDCEGLTVNH